MNSIGNNMKNEIDDLFYQKLANLHIEPSESAKAQFMALAEKKNKKKPIWYFSAAASLLLISSMGWFVLNQNPKVDNIAKADTPYSIIENNESVPTKVIDEIKVEAKTPSINSSIKTIAPSTLKKKEAVEKPVNLELALIDNPQQVSLTGVSEIDELIDDKLTIALKTAENKRNNDLLKAETPIKTNTLFQKGAGETIVIVSSELNMEEDIYIPNINSDSPISLAEATYLGMAQMNDDRSLIAKVFKEIKNLKHGEKVSFASLSASNDSYFINKDNSLIEHETYEFRQRFNWLKDKLSKDY
jgi:hypothetical protein